MGTKPSHRAEQETHPEKQRRFFVWPFKILNASITRLIQRSTHFPEYLALQTRPCPAH